MDSLLSLKEAATRLACSEAMLRKWIHQGKLPTVKVGRLTRVSSRGKTCIPSSFSSRLWRPGSGDRPRTLRASRLRKERTPAKV